MALVCMGGNVPTTHAPRLIEVTALALVVPDIGPVAPRPSKLLAIPLVTPLNARIAASTMLLTHETIDPITMLTRFVGAPLPSNAPLSVVLFMAYSIWITRVPAATNGTSDTLNVLGVPIVSEYNKFPEVNAS